MVRLYGSVPILGPRAQRSTGLAMAGMAMVAVVATVVIIGNRRPVSMLQEVDESVYDEARPGYNAENCISNPFPELPPGFLCTSVRFGVYLIDPYGSLYNRRVQWKVRQVVRDETGQAEQVVANAPEEERKRMISSERSHWVSPLDWLRPALLPNQEACQAAIEGFYASISAPNNTNLTDAAAFLAPDYVYQGPKSTLLPACVPAIGSGRQAVGPEAWATALEEQIAAFGPSTSALDGNVSCVPIKTDEPLAPRMKCTAKHVCTFELKSLKNTTGGVVTLTGDFTDTFFFDKNNLIVYSTSDADPTMFHALAEETQQSR